MCVYACVCLCMCVCVCVCVFVYVCVCCHPVDADIECVRWNPHLPAVFLASTENGTVVCRDALKPESKALFTLR